MRTGDKKALTIIAAVVAVFVIVVGGTVAVLTSHSRSGQQPDEQPHLQLAVGNRLIRVGPTRMCDLYLRNCKPEDARNAKVQKVPVGIGQSVVLTASRDIAQWPWKLVAQYLTPHGPVEDPVAMRSGATYSTVLHSTPASILVNIEVQLPSVIPETDSAGAQAAVAARGYIAADTTPRGLRLTGMETAG